MHEEDPEVAWVAHEGVRSGGDELVVGFEGELEGEVCAEGAVAEDSDVGADVNENAR